VLGRIDRSDNFTHGLIIRQSVTSSLRRRRFKRTRSRLPTALSGDRKQERVDGISVINRTECSIAGGKIVGVPKGRTKSIP
jgi:hypothetical protein